ncbi:hypothetical protein [Paenibacillus radicis (ex Gao et al. 2016)]|uniref:WD40 repeat domain-containing protein n=1 Tax=Paenibacillus radicis (ex Gao et al. 2016) TaxID=1737354 RepID=A0A917GX48_9BACL|nr:hypothetical protein [Paenibacillus radicis (ex Gao et al. 2016)]GGG59727.1 hypothetical protein GCM10010918_11140 [Paenibacillus radicis (ex Gao et al. 2016)]
MRYFVSLIVVMFVLTGCTSTEQPPVNKISDISSEAAKAAPSPSPSPDKATIQPDELVEPSLYFEQFETVPEHQRVVMVRSNVDMQKDSFNWVLESTLKKSDEKAELNYTLEWETPRFLQIRFQYDKEALTFMFNLNEAKTVDGRTFARKDQPNSNKVIVRYNGRQSSLILKNPLTNKQSIIPVWDTNWIKTIKASGGAEASYLFYGKDQHHLFTISNHKTLELPVVLDKHKDGYGNDYGYNDMYSDQFYSGYTYLIQDNKRLYKVGLKDGKRELLYKFDKPVYGLSSSPDGKKIAVLYAHDDLIGPVADLKVFDAKGKPIYTLENAAHMSHSGGFLFVYPLSWADNSHLILPADVWEENPLGRIVLDFGSKKQSVLTDKRLTKQVIADLFAHEKNEDYYAVSTIRWSPDSKLAAFQISDGQIWIYNTKDRSFQFAGAGTLLDWTPDGKLAWANTLNVAYRF